MITAAPITSTPAPLPPVDLPISGMEVNSRSASTEAVIEAAKKLGKGFESLASNKTLIDTWNQEASGILSKAEMAQIRNENGIRVEGNQYKNKAVKGIFESVGGAIVGSGVWGGIAALAGGAFVLAAAPFTLAGMAIAGSAAATAGMFGAAGGAVHGAARPGIKTMAGQYNDFKVTKVLQQAAEIGAKSKNKDEMKAGLALLAEQNEGLLDKQDRYTATAGIVGLIGGFAASRKMGRGVMVSAVIGLLGAAGLMKAESSVMGNKGDKLEKALMKAAQVGYERAHEQGVSQAPERQAEQATQRQAEPTRAAEEVKAESKTENKATPEVETIVKLGRAFDSLSKDEQVAVRAAINKGQAHENYDAYTVAGEAVAKSAAQHSTNADAYELMGKAAVKATASYATNADAYEVMGKEALRQEYQREFSDYQTKGKNPPIGSPLKTASLEEAVSGLKDVSQAKDVTRVEAPANGVPVPQEIAKGVGKG